MTNTQPFPQLESAQSEAVTLPVVLQKVVITHKQSFLKYKHSFQIDCQFFNHGIELAPYTHPVCFRGSECY